MVPIQGLEECVQMVHRNPRASSICSDGRSAGQSRWKRTKGQLLRWPKAGGETAFAGGEWLTDNTVGSARAADVRLVQTEE